MLNWKTVTGAANPKFLVKGTELSVTLCGEHSRFQICEIRCLDADGNPDRRYAIRDAETVSDADVRAKIRPKIVAWLARVDEAIAF
jgi:hypothetical protein